ncbi:MAG TPA: cytochrome c [Opitutaceae bacterium]|nr:cytochrome c [Opitutaceae bacterium]
MSPVHRRLAACLCVALAGGWALSHAAESEAGAGAPPPAAPTRSVWSGVYSAEQAARGLKGYNAQCARCHGETLGGGEDSPALVDQDFLGDWNGKSVGSLVEYTRKKMPSDGPGKLSRQLCTDIVAYLLSANGFPAGSAGLEPDVDVLNRISIEPKK